jgi:hypothetical protein
LEIGVITSLKWIAAIILIIGCGINGYGIYPHGIMLMNISGLLWIYVAFKVKDYPLLVTNAVVIIVSIVAICIKSIGRV